MNNIAFNISKNEKGKPTKNMKKLIKILKEQFKCSLYKDIIKLEKI